MLAEGVDVKTRMDRLGHVNDRVNIIHSHANDEAQMQASELIWQNLMAAGLQLKQRQPAAALSSQRSSRGKGPSTNLLKTWQGWRDSNPRPSD